jgi:hypothetical protein
MRYTHASQLGLIVALAMSSCGDDVPQGADAEAGIPDTSDTSGDSPIDVLGDFPIDAVGDQVIDSPDVQVGVPDADEPDPVERDQDADSASDEGGNPVAPIEISNLLVIESPTNVLAYFVEWQTDAEASTHLTIDCGEEYRHAFEDSALSTRHEVFVMGLIDGLACELTMTSQNGARTGSTTATIERVGPLPNDLVTLTVVADLEQMQPGWTLTNIASTEFVAPKLLTFIDEQGRYRWYHVHAASNWRGTATDVRTVEDGILVSGVGRSPRPFAQRIGWDGTMLWEAPFRSHHHVQLSPFGEDRLLYLSWDTLGCSEDLEEGVVAEFDLSSGETIWTWRVCEHYEPPVDFRDWTHLNAVANLPGEDSILLSVRNQNNIMRINRLTDELEWILGDNGDFEIALEDRFLRQHAPEVQPDGNILLFDNGQAGSRPYSRALELALEFDDDGRPLRAVAVWDYTDLAVFGTMAGDADRLPNGNTLITYRRSVPGGFAILLREVTHEGEVIWSVESDVGWAIYRAERTQDPPYGYVVTSP